MDVGKNVARLLPRLGIDPFQVLGRALVVLGADVERQVAALAAGIDQVLRIVDLALVDEAVALEDVSPAT